MTNTTFKTAGFDEFELSEAFDIPAELARHLEGREIIVGPGACPGYYNIRFKYLIDETTEKSLCLEAVSEEHISTNLSCNKPSDNLSDEKTKVLESIFNEMTTKYTNDSNVLTSNLLDLIINKCNDLKKSDF